MAVDLTVQMINATVQIDQPLGNGTRTVGTGFLVQAPTADGQPRVVLVTAGHVLNRMPNAEARLGWRFQDADGVWRYQPQPLQIRASGEPLWTKHPTRDVVVMAIQAPAEFARAAIPLSWLADDTTFDRYAIGAGDEMIALGFPEGLASNKAGFPILRVGRLASYPLSPVKEFPTFLLDFRVFAGNSGGPVFTTVGLRRGPQATAEDPPQLVTGVLTQQTTVDDQRLEIGIVTHAAFVREAIALLDQPRAVPQPAPAPPDPRAGATPTRAPPRPVGVR
jgi:S1-C subfamily serine protease